jgi:hypothetical protein
MDRQNPKYETFETSGKDDTFAGEQPCMMVSASGMDFEQGQAQSKDSMEAARDSYRKRDRKWWDMTVILLVG